MNYLEEKCPYCQTPLEERQDEVSGEKGIELIRYLYCPTCQRQVGWLDYPIADNDGFKNNYPEIYEWISYNLKEGIPIDESINGHDAIELWRKHS